MSNAHNTEIEIQVKVENASALQAFLEKNGEFISDSQQRDEYFMPIHRDFLKVRPLREWLRLRNADGKMTINYKNWHYNEAGLGIRADEYESSISDIDALRNIFSVLDFRSVVEVMKRRTIWNYRDHEISIDKVEGLGDFVEVEYKGSESPDPEEMMGKMIGFLKDAGCGKILLNNGGYPLLLLFPDEADYREV